MITLGGLITFLSSGLGSFVLAFASKFLMGLLENWKRDAELKSLQETETRRKADQEAAGKRATEIRDETARGPFSRAVDDL